MDGRFYTGRVEEHNTLEQHFSKEMGHGLPPNDDPLRWRENRQKRDQQQQLEPDYVPYANKGSAAASMGQYPPDVQPGNDSYSNLSSLSHEGLALLSSTCLQGESSSAMETDYSNIDPRLRPADASGIQSDSSHEVRKAIDVEINKNSGKFKNGDTGDYICKKHKKYHKLKYNKEWENTDEDTKKEILRCHNIYNRIYYAIAQERGANSIKNQKDKEKRREIRKKRNHILTNIRRYARTKGMVLPVLESNTERKALKKFKEEREKDPSKLSAHAQQRSDDAWNAKAKGYNSDDYVTSDPEPPVPVAPGQKRWKKRL